MLNFKVPKRAYIIALSGPACAGKSTLADRLTGALSGYLIGETVREVLDSRDTTLANVAKGDVTNFLKFQRDILDITVDYMKAIFTSISDRRERGDKEVAFVIMDRGPLDIITYTIIGLLKRNQFINCSSFERLLLACWRGPAVKGSEVELIADCVDLLSVVNLQVFCEPVEWQADGVRSLEAYGGQLIERTVLEGLWRLLYEASQGTFNMPRRIDVHGNIAYRLANILHHVHNWAYPTDEEGWRWDLQRLAWQRRVQRREGTDMPGEEFEPGQQLAKMVMEQEERND